MVFATKLNDDHHEIEIVSDKELLLSDNIIRRMILLLNDLSDKIDSGLKELQCTRENGFINYTFETNDGRIWNQSIEFAQYPDTDPKLTFNVTSGFKLSEFAPHRDIRYLIIQMTNEIGLVSMVLEVIP